jgi:hypothetical protein
MPANSGLYQSPLLSQIAVDFKNRDYIADQVLTPVIVPKLTGQYMVWDQGVTFKTPRTAYGQDGQVSSVDIKGSKASFSLNIEALSTWIDELEIQQADLNYIRALKAQKLANAMRLRLELDVAAQLRSTSVLTQNATLAGVTQWSDYTNSDPANAILTQQDNLPRKANTLILGRQVLTALKRHPKILDVTKYTQRGFAPTSVLCDLFEVDRILVGEAMQDTAADGQAASKAFIWGKDAILAYIDPSPPSPLMDQPTLGYIPRMGGSGTTPWRTFTALVPTVGTGAGREWMKVETSYGVLVSAPTMAFLWKNAVA